MNQVPDFFDQLIPQAAPGTSPWETVPASEAQAIAAITGAIEARVRVAARTAPARRDAHPKAHGCVEAEFRVLDGLPPHLRKGLFAQPRSYQAWIRFSNGSGTPQEDSVGDGRGMAVKVTGVEQSRSGTQDFIMINNPAFFVRDAADYVAFNASDNPLRFFLPGLNPLHFRWHELAIARSITGRTVLNPLAIQYWSMTPYLFGDGPCKFSARPIGPPPAFADDTEADFLHDNLVRSLEAADAAFDFCIQLRTKPEAMPVEDPTIEWPEADAPFTPVARIIIRRQVFDTPERAVFAENLSFTPWHGLAAHRPLGGINRVRRTVYETISRLRHDLNGTPRGEPLPTAFSTPPHSATFREASMSSSLFDNLRDGLLGFAGGLINASGWADKTASKLVIDNLCATTRNRPHPLSTASDYTSWKSLTDKTYQARHLPPVDLKVQPPADAVAKLFERPDGTQTLSRKSTCLFPAFAQYLTDGFIRTEPKRRNRTTTNHEIDLCPLYGRIEAQTDILREKAEAPGRRGRLKSQFVDGEEYPPYLYTRDGLAIEAAFAGLDPPLLGPPGAPEPALEQLTSLFAVGGDRANGTPFTSMMNTLLLREHNRVAGELERRNPGWDDERVFQTARNIMIPMFIKIVIEQYINHITPLPFNLTADPSIAWRADWNRPNWITVEFSLLYRWHSLMPDAIEWADRTIPLGGFGIDNRPLIDVGLAAGFAAAAAQPAGALGVCNTSKPILGLERLAIEQARSNRLASYNAYREHFGMSRATTFAEITSDPTIAEKLAVLYPTPDDVEFYPGLFAEDRDPKSPLPGLLMRMVGVDAFTQALTNPLLSEHVYNADTFTPWGLELIESTSSLGDILVRQGAEIDPRDITMTQPGWRYGWHIA